MQLRPRRLGTPVVLGVAAVTLAALAASSHGFPVRHVSLNDGGIWVTNNRLGTVGRFTKPIAQLDGEITPASASPSVDVWQDGPVVAAYDAGGGRMYAVNVYGTSFAGGGTVVSRAQNGVALGGTRLAVLGTDHALRAVTLQPGGGSLAALAGTARPLAAHLPAGSAVAVGGDDTIWVAGGGELRGYAQGAAKPAVTSLPLPASGPMLVTTVGNVPVVADPATKTLYLPGSGRKVALPSPGSSPGLKLQQPSQASDVVVAATSAALYSVNLSTGRLATLSSGHSGTVAAPVQVAGCVHAAWANGSAGSYVRTCGAPPPATKTTRAFPIGDSVGPPSLVFRVNNGSVVLNDTTDGGVFLAGAKVTSVTPKWQRGPVGANSTIVVHNRGARQKNQFKTTPLTQGVRPGVTTEVHVLDAVDGDPALTYAVTAVGSPDQPGVTVSVAPDAQTVLATVTSLATDAHFQYTVDDGHGHSATGEVTLVPRTPGENSAPYLKQGYQPPSLSVASDGRLVVPVIGDWRDGDGDPLYIGSGSVSASAGAAAVTSGGALSFTAPHTTVGETVTLTYGVSDGRVAKPAMATLKVTVLGSSSVKFVRPVAEPDAAQAEVGRPVTLHPLANDLPGVDPTNPAAELRLAGPVSSALGATVSTDVTDGTVSFTAQRAGDFFLTYTDAYGAAPTAKATIRVHVVPAPGKPQPPVTTPDVAVLHGQQPALVDVLADDHDPQGWLLGVTDATSATPGVHVTVIDQKWLRISAGDSKPGMAATVTYTVSDGKGSATGTVAVSAVPADPSADQITTTNAAITVRAGDSAAVPVLAGDASSTGLPLSLAGTPSAASPPVAGLIASAQGANIRVDAPASVKTEEETTVSYVATDADGTTAAGELDVTIMPAPSKASPDQAPVPQEVDTRESAGDTAVIQVPVSGVDPDGDSVTVTGVTVPPALGRIVAIGPDTISYQSYPGSAGTDTFTYQVTDPYGLTGTAQVRVAVLPPGPPRPPAAVDDVIEAPPGASLHWNVLGNDYIAPGDKVTVEPLAKTNKKVPAGVRLAGDYAYLRVPSSPSGPPVEFTYGATDGSTPSLAQVIVHAVTGAKIPPIARDAVASLPRRGADTVTVNVLKNDDDPVGTPSDLKISRVPAGVTVNGADLTIRLTSYPREVPYAVTAPDGLTATAVVYVPGSRSSTITLKPGARIIVKQDGTAVVPLNSVLTDSAGRQLKITTTNELTASPQGALTVSASQETAFTLHALGGYTGPGAVTVQVYDGATMQDKNGTIATITIPVHVGSDVPVLHCPATPLQVVEGGAAQSYDIGQLCHVSVDTTIIQAPPRYTATWGKTASGVSASVRGGTSLELSAASGAAPGTAGTLKITPAGATTGGTLNVQVVKAPLPVGSPASASVKAGQSVTVDLSQYVTSPLLRPVISVLSVATQAGPAATVTHSGSKVIVTPGANASGTLTLAARVSDEPGRKDRSVTVAVTVTVIGHPGAPGAPTVTASSRTLVVSFGAAAANGAPVEYYTVYANRAGHRCPASPCTITGLTNGATYTVHVTATNSAGTGPDSAQATAKPNAVPGRVTGLTATPGLGAVTLTWQPAADSGTPVTGYRVEVSPPPAEQRQPESVGVTTSHTFTGLTNGTTYTFTVLAVNAATSSAGPGPWSRGVTAVPYGKPQTMAAPTATGAAVPGPSATLGITVSWPAVQGTAANGSQVTGYNVSQYRATSSGGPWTMVGTPRTVGPGTTSTSYTVGNDGSWYEFSVTATNAAGTSLRSSSSPAIQAAALPNPPVGVTAKATGQSDTIQFSFTPAAANAKQVSSIRYGINRPARSGTITGPFTAGTSYTETLTNAMNGAITDGAPVTVYVAECNDAGLCSSFAGPSGQVVPYGPITTPTVTATANGTTIAYTWSAQSDGLTETLQVCIASTCTDHTVPATGGYSGSSSASYGYSQKETITARLTDTAGQSSGTATASATTQAPPPTVSTSAYKLIQGSVTCNGSSPTLGCYNIKVVIAHFPANSAINYSCSNVNGQFWPAGGGTVTAPYVNTDASGSATFYTTWTSSGNPPTNEIGCVYTVGGPGVTITVTVGSVSASG